MIDSNNYVGVYVITNTLAVIVHKVTENMAVIRFTDETERQLAKVEYIENEERELIPHIITAGGLEIPLNEVMLARYDSI